jgi:DNA-binding NarL/FixJ family response regulator
VVCEAFYADSNIERLLSAAQDRANVIKALDLGAMGYIPKSARNEVMLSALQLVFAGGMYIPPEILAREHLSHTAAPSGGGRAIVSPADLGLTDRQLDVLVLMMQGRNNKSICRTLNLAEPTVKNHVTAILKALKVTNRTEAVIAANELGWKLMGESSPAVAGSAPPTTGLPRVVCEAFYADSNIERSS